MNLQDDAPRTGRPDSNTSSGAAGSPDGIARDGSTGPGGGGGSGGGGLGSGSGSGGRGGDGVTDRLGRALEYVTFGRRPLLLFRIWVVQVVLLLADVGVFRSVYPLLRDVFRPDILLEACVVLTFGCLALLWTYLGKMGRLTFAPRFHRTGPRCWSTLGYLALGGVIVAGAFHVLDMTPGVSGPHLVLDLALAALLTAALAALLAIGFYAQFGAGAFPRHRHTQRVVEEWLAALDWPAPDEGTTEKDRHYTEFETRTRQVATLLDTALTRDGRTLRDEFHEWQSAVQQYSLLTQERIVAGDARTPELAAHHERLASIHRRLARLADADTTVAEEDAPSDQ